ncbi:MAG: nitroreductase family protein [Crocinitomicaceae bacterium]|nr:nitroreductase family protein [Crocinitomicaceae bacterium]
MSSVKTAQTKYPVLDVIRNRWSARSFSEKEISSEIMETLIEAATWAFSANNEQPWRYAVAYKNTPEFEKFFSLLMGGNQPWCKNAAALVLSLGKKNYTSNNQLNTAMMHDVGSANMLLTLQANSMGIYTHVLGGYHADKVADVFNLPEELTPVYMIALGYLDDHEKLEEPFRTREITPRSRKPISEIIVDWK